MVNIDGHEVEFGRVPSPPDENDKLYPMKLVLPIEPVALPESTFWDLPVNRLDQNGWPECVAFAWRHWGGTSPVRTPTTLAQARELYKACKLVDDYDGDGTWVRIALKILKDTGVIGRYLWAESVDDIRRYVLLEGPVVVGTPWFEGMSTPDANHVMRPTGAAQGGHAWVIYGADAVYAYMLNSWGDWWGDHGTAKISWADLATLFTNGQSEAAGAEEIGARVPLTVEQRLARLETVVADSIFVYSDTTNIVALRQAIPSATVGQKYTLKTEEALTYAYAQEMRFWLGLQRLQNAG